MRRRILECRAYFLALVDVFHQAPWELPVLFFSVVITQKGPIEWNTECTGQEVKRTITGGEPVDPRCKLVLVARVGWRMLWSCLVACVDAVEKFPLEELQLIGDEDQVLVDSLQI